MDIETVVFSIMDGPPQRQRSARVAGLVWGMCA